MSHDSFNGQQELCRALGVGSLAELHPNAAEVITRRVLTLDHDSLTHLIHSIDQAKTRHAARPATPTSGPSRPAHHTLT